MEHAAIESFAQRLLGAYESGTPIAPLIAEAPDATIEDAYAVQLAQVAHWQLAGREIAGFKIGLTSKAIQRQLNVDRPDFGHLFKDTVLDASAPIDLGRFIAPRIEPEVSFVLKSNLAGPGLTMIDVLRAVDYAIASVEIIDSRIADWKITLPDTIADNASFGSVVLGTRPLRISDIDLGMVGCVVTRNGDVVSTGAGAAVLGNPLNSVLFLANTLGSLGRSIPAGSIVMAGALSGAVPIAPGDSFITRFSHFGSVSTSFTKGNE